MNMQAGSSGRLASSQSEPSEKPDKTEFIVLSCFTMTPMDQLQGMRVFTRVAELGSFARAAHTLDLSRAMASSYVAQLENIWAHACSIARRAKYRFRRRARCTSNTANASSPISKRLMTSCASRAIGRRASCASTSRSHSANTCCCPRFRCLPQRYPDIALEVRFNDRYVDIAAERVDVAVRVGKVSAPDIIAKRIAASRLLTCASPQYLANAACRALPRSCASTVSSVICVAMAPGRQMAVQTGRGHSISASPDGPILQHGRCTDLFGAGGARDGAAARLLVSSYLNEGRLVEVLRDYSCEGPPLSVIYPRATQHLAGYACSPNSPAT
jgi:LysR family transcriptional regulator for bpeEF and oprC